MVKNMKILIIDNYDSFTYNLYQYFGEVLGEVPTVITNDSTLEISEDDYDAVVVSPGPGNPASQEDFGISKSFIENTQKPLLGICLGHQGVVLSEGGKVEHAPEPIHGRSYDVLHSGHAQFNDIPETFSVIRYHSLVAQYPIPENLEVTAKTKDGLVMAVAHRDKPIWGVQFHPESINTEYGKQILRNFIQFAEEHKRQQDLDAQATSQSQNKEKEKWQCSYEKLNGDFDPAKVYGALFDTTANGYWLDSGKDASGYHFMGDAQGPHAYQVTYRLGQPLEIKKSSGDTEYIQKDIFSLIESVMIEGVKGTGELPFSFTGGLVGYLGYELKQLRFPDKNAHISNEPDACLLFSDQFIAINREEQTLYLVGLHKADEDQARINDWFATTKASLRSLNKADVPKPNITSTPLKVVSDSKASSVDFHLEQGREEYIAAIHASQEHIRNGESYEICLTNRLKTEVKAEPWDLYNILRTVNPAPYSAFLRYDDFSVLSSSPERFLKVMQNGIVEAKPIKGTRPRNKNPQLDEALARDLAKDEKDRAENLMITDLLRNDLGIVCEIGSVWAPKLMDVESYETVHQLVSTIRGQLPQDASLADIVKATFPGGSMTGAPKRRTLTIIDELEHSARGIYSGSIGYFSLNGTLDLNIVIRSIVCRGQSLEIGVGGAIISLSDPEVEYAEILVKGEALMKSIAKYQTGNQQAYKLCNVSGEEINLEDIKQEFFYSKQESLVV